MSLVRITPPAVEPLTIAEVAAHLRLDASNEEPTPDAPTVALAGAGAGNVDNGAHRYRFTFVTADGETDGGAISGVVTVADKAVNGKVTLTNIPLGGSSVTARKVYRTKAGLEAFLLAAVIGNNTSTTLVDNLADASLGAGVPTTNTTGDPLLLALIRAARELVEKQTNHALITQTWRIARDCFPCEDVIDLGIPPVQSVTVFTYVDTSGTVVPFTGYTLDGDSFPGRVVRNYGICWPSTREQRNAVKIEFKAGFGDAASGIPAALRQAMLLAIGTWYENREGINVGNIVTPLPMAFDALIAPYRRPAMEMA
jgi:uncharacterized phiE125 gp8 family phage protein